MVKVAIDSSVAEFKVLLEEAGHRVVSEANEADIYIVSSPFDNIEEKLPVDCRTYINAEGLTPGELRDLVSCYS